MATLQECVARLTAFWGEQGCVVLPPHDLEVGTATMVPEVFLRLLGPEPWRSAHLQASRRPWDGRLGRSNLRLGKHFQLEVLLKPAEQRGRDLLLASLQKSGVDLTQHDIRFDPVSWRVRMLGVRGEGWEVRLDGVEVAHFVYLQEAAETELDPVSLEICYGVERLALLQQGVGSFTDIVWGAGVSYNEVRQRDEEDFSRYYFEISDPVLVRSQLDNCLSEAQLCLERELVLPAYELTLRAAHLFQVLVFRGHLPEEEEEAVRGSIRRLAVTAAQAYQERRRLRSYPLSPPSADDGGEREASRRSGGENDGQG